MKSERLILIVEDNERNLKLVRDILHHLGYRTLEARSAEEGVALAREHGPDLTLMDVQLPGMDGVQALAQLRSDTSTADLRVVAVTAFAMKEDRERLLAEGFDGYLEKPLDVHAFPDQIATLLSGADAGARA